MSTLESFDKEIVSLNRLFLNVAKAMVRHGDVAIAQDVLGLSIKDLEFLAGKDLVELDQLADVRGLLFKPSISLVELGLAHKAGMGSLLFQLHNPPKI